MSNKLDHYLQLIDHLLKKNFSEICSDNNFSNISEITKLIGFYIKIVDFQQKEKINVNEIWNKK